MVLVMLVAFLPVLYGETVYLVVLLCAQEGVMWVQRTRQTTKSSLASGQYKNDHPTAHELRITNS